MTSLRGRRSAAALSAFAAGVALAAPAGAAAQTQTPTELWEEYPLEPERSPAPAEDQSEGVEPSARQQDDEAPVGGDRRAVPADGEEVPLLPLAAAAAALAALLVTATVAILRGGAGLRVGASVVSFRGQLLARVEPIRTTRLFGGGRPGVTERKKRSRIRGEQTAPPAKKSSTKKRPPARRPAAKPQTSRSKQHAPAAPEKPVAPPSEPAAASSEQAAAAPSEPALAEGEQARAASSETPRAPSNPAPAPSKRGSAAGKPPSTARKPPSGARKPASAAKKPVSAPPKPAHAPVKPVQAARRKPPKLPSRHGSLADALSPAVAKETCVIVWRREGTHSDFYAVADSSERGEYVVASSPRFDWIGGDVPPAAWVAYDRLMATLAEGGWRFVGTEGSWYRRRFERPEGGYPGLVEDREPRSS